MRAGFVNGVLALAMLALLASAGWLWLAGGAEVLAAWAQAGQERTQRAMAGFLRQLRAGEAGALTGLLGLCFAYGFFHAAGPGHGKALIGGYGVARRIPALRLSLVALGASVAQALSAIALVHAGLWALDATRERLTGLAEGTMTTASYAAVALIGLWLALRGTRRLWRLRPGRSRPDDVPNDAASTTSAPACAGCGHRHAPTPEEVRALTGWREIGALIAAVAVRPCTGALFLLILTWQLGVAGAGILGALAMGLGTASVTVLVALAAVTLREGALSRLVAAAPAGLAARALPLVEMAAGAMIATLAVQLLRAGL